MIAKALASFLALLALATPVAAQAPTVPEPVKTGPGTRFFAGNPPPRFIKEGASVVVFVAPERIAVLCGALPPPGLTIVACARRLKDGTPIIIAPHPVMFPNELFARIMLHEHAHAVGMWPAEHPL